MMACLAEGLSAQEGCFKYNFKKAKQQFSSGDYILARKYFQAAESCFDLPPGQLTVISDKIAACDDSIKVQDELKNRRLVAQSLYGLAKTAVAENQYLKALRFMRYANAYFPDNPEFLPVMARLVYEGPHHAADTSSSKTMSLLPIRSVKIDTTPFPGLVEENTYHSFQYYDFDGDFRAKLSLDSRYLLIRSISGIRLVDLENGIDKLLIADPRDRQFEFINYGKNIIIYEHKDFYYLDPQESYGGKYDYSEVSIWNTQGELLLSLKNPRAVRSFPYNGLLWVVPENRDSLVLYNCDGRLLRNFDFDATVNYICANRVAE
ncbi:MAG: hypothetical protein H6558_07215, partial [Lewinellaceae bacterium]|nr:hypothetical protein [Lewinellaceae bacterium]